MNKMNHKTVQISKCLIGLIGYRLKLDNDTKASHYLFVFLLIFGSQKSMKNIISSHLIIFYPKNSEKKKIQCENIYFGSFT